MILRGPVDGVDEIFGNHGRVSTLSTVLEFSEYVAGHESRLVRAALTLRARRTKGNMSSGECRLVDRASRVAVPKGILDALRAAIASGRDPLGEELCAIRAQTYRRERGAFYTEPHIVTPMVKWVLSKDVTRIVDPGSGTGRFGLEAFRQAPDLKRIVAIELDPLAALLARANFATVEAECAVVLNADYPTLRLKRFRGRTGFVGNPPYVRHHDISERAKRSATKLALTLKHKISGMAGLHTYFFLATAAMAAPGDVGCFVTSAEWLDVNYGSIIRDLFLNGLGGQGIHLLDRSTFTFAGVKTTAAITTFSVGSRAEVIDLQSVTSPLVLGRPQVGEGVARASLTNASRWSHLFKEATTLAHDGPSLSSIVRVHRGTATGANKFFVMTREQAQERGLLRWCVPVVTRGEQILASGGEVRVTEDTALLLDLPPDFDRAKHPRVDAYLKLGERAADGDLPISRRNLPSHRDPWWSVKPVRPPIVATYMARQAPMFATNPSRLALLNIAHGLYPLRELDESRVEAIVRELNLAREDFLIYGRTYFGALTKFEPKEMASLPLPKKLAEF